MGSGTQNAKDPCAGLPNMLEEVKNAKSEDWRMRFLISEFLTDTLRYNNTLMHNYQPTFLK